MATGRNALILWLVLFGVAGPRPTPGQLVVRQDWGLYTVAWAESGGGEVALRYLFQHPGSAWLDWAPVGGRVLVFQPGGRRVVEGDGYRTVMEVQGKRPYWSLDGRTLLVARDGRIYRIDTDTQTEEQLFVGREDVPAALHAALSPDGRQVLMVVHAPYECMDCLPPVYLADVTGGEVRLVSARGNLDVDQPFSPHGRCVITTENLDGIYEFRVTDLQTMQVVARAAEEVHNPTWSPDGQVVAYDGGSLINTSSIWTLHLDGRREELVPIRDRYPSDPPISHLATYPVWSPDGSRIAFTVSHLRDRGASSEGSEVFLVNRDGSGLRPLVEGSVHAWLPEGTLPVATVVAPEPPAPAAAGPDTSASWAQIKQLFPVR
ncbi:MAG: hypothetical protein AB1505_06140 [Candidatus Latescibacterota bacterium]